MRRELIPYAIPFRRRIATGAGEWSIRRGAWLRLESEDGLVGLGEVAPIGRVSSAMAASVAEEGPLFDAALALATLDLQGQREGRSIASILGAEPRTAVACNALCFEEALEAAGREAAEAVASGFATLKLKVGAAAPDRDIERIREVRRQAAGARLRLDANGAWDLATAARVLRAVAGPDIEYVEDPVAGGIAAGRDVLQVPVAVDARSIDEGWRVVRGKTADFLVLKPMALGGLAACRALAVAATESGIGVVVTSVFDTAVGVAGALHLAASLPGPARAHGLATAGLLEEAPLQGLEPPHAGWIQLPQGPGLGVRFCERVN